MSSINRALRDELIIMSIALQIYDKLATPPNILEKKSPKIQP